MKTFNTIEAALKTNKAIIVKSKNFNFNGLNRVSLTVQKANGKRLYNVVQYENGSFSSAV
jgi:hypothetical protein